MWWHLPSLLRSIIFPFIPSYYCYSDFFVRTPICCLHRQILGEPTDILSSCPFWLAAVRAVGHTHTIPFKHLFKRTQASSSECACEVTVTDGINVTARSHRSDCGTAAISLHQHFSPSPRINVCLFPFPRWNLIPNKLFESHRYDRTWNRVGPLEKLPQNQVYAKRNGGNNLEVCICR